MVSFTMPDGKNPILRQSVSLPSRERRADKTTSSARHRLESLKVIQQLEQGGDKTNSKFSVQKIS
jgi:hypothetical protein